MPLMISGDSPVSFSTLFFTVEPIHVMFHVKSLVLMGVAFISNSKPLLRMSPTLAL